MIRQIQWVIQPNKRQLHVRSLLHRKLLYGPRCERLTDPSVAEQEPEEQRFFRLCEVWVIAETLFAVVRGFRPTLLSVVRCFATLFAVVRGFGPSKRRITARSVRGTVICMACIPVDRCHEARVS